MALCTKPEAGSGQVPGVFRKEDSRLRDNQDPGSIETKEHRGPGVKLTVHGKMAPRNHPKPPEAASDKHGPGMKSGLACV